MAVAFRLDLVGVYFAFSRGTAATIHAEDSALREMKRDGSFLQIYRKRMAPHPVRRPLAALVTIL
ncbi:hypothetical protein [Duganella sp.]|uniref:hypothetical protein n=1 Tax=Duganella sp. TaxID=1904440 RepID=UPI0031D96E29